MKSDLDLRWFNYSFQTRIDFYKKYCEDCNVYSLNDILTIWHSCFGYGYEYNQLVDFNPPFPIYFHFSQDVYPDVYYNRLMKKAKAIKYILEDLKEENNRSWIDWKFKNFDTEIETAKKKLNNQYGRLISTIPDSILQRWGYTHQEKE